MIKPSARPRRGSPGRGIGRLALALCILAPWPSQAARAATPATPSELFGPLYAAVETLGIFPDSKTFADATPRRAPLAIMADYREGLTAEQLGAFVALSFDVPADGAAAPVRPRPTGAAPEPVSLRDHIAALWPVLARPPVTAPPFASQLSLAYPFVVPGGRFREVYYWDSYFTSLGLVRDGRADLAKGLVDNFSDLIERYGHVPNGARTYYASRSQPPVFFLMTSLLEPRDPAAAHARYLGALRREYGFWMRGEDDARPGRPVGRVVRFADGAVLNRYWDDSDRPRDESYREDVALAARSGRPPAELYRDVRAAAESGWDFSSRWMTDPASLSSLDTTAIAPVDLNSLMFGLERAIAGGCRRAGDVACARAFEARAERRRRAVDRHLWDPAKGEYLDYDWRAGRRTNRPSAAMLYPLFQGLASREQARRVAIVVKRDLLAPGGLRTTLARTGQQWDAPNGWAPLQWIAVTGLERYGEPGLAREIATRWLATVCRTYRENGRLLEKYDVEESRPGGGGEYPLQDGFGWTNGVTRALLSVYASAAPDQDACRG